MAQRVYAPRFGGDVMRTAIGYCEACDEEVITDEDFCHKCGVPINDWRHEYSPVIEGGNGN